MLDADAASGTEYESQLAIRDDDTPYIRVLSS